MKILMVASEAAPFAKTGGLADVLGSLPGALIKQGAEVRVIMPKYGTISSKLRESIVHKCVIYVGVGWRNLYCGIEEAVCNGVTYYFIDNEFYFNRDGLYGFGDDGERFAFFCRAVLEAIPHLDFTPDILHCHDWQAGMVPVLLEAHYRQLELYRPIKTVFTIHNLRYQGICGIDQMKEWFSLSDDYFTEDKLEFFHSASFMKGGLTYSHLLSTVSHSYAEEIKYPFYGEQLDGLLNARSKELWGIVNGIDYEEFNPAKDPLIYQTYTKTKLAGKDANKVALQEELGLAVDEKIPVIGLISRLVDQKGLDLIACVLDEILAEEVQFVVLGTGDGKYEHMFWEATRRYPGKVSANLRFDNTLAHKIYAASDLFLMPSLFEPCGLGQLISLRYGTLPIVRETGGLKDTVISYNEATGEGNGFSFANYNAHDMLYTIRRATGICRKKTLRNKLRKAAMSCDFSWQSSAGKYMELYHTLVPEAVE
ncbi:MAG TPA: glycogen synthase GlgA [Clostridiales bacterium]|nr:glycogen synthase GlgA [Clostridiales bacterium]